MRTTKGREEGRVTDAAGLRVFRAKKVRLAPPSAPGSAWVRRRCFRPMPAKIGLLGARLGRFFGAGAKKNAWGGLPGGAAGDALRALLVELLNSQTLVAVLRVEKCHF